MDQPSYSTKPYVEWPFLGPAQAPDEIGRLGQYRVLKQLGQGGMGIVFRAEDERLKRPAALKVMRPDFAAQDDARQRFLREAQAAAKLKHDHIVTIYQVDEHNGVPFLAMEFLAGKSLEEWLRPDRRATVAETLNLGRQIAKGLAAAHAAGLVHRDIKPANLWLEAPRGRVKILDFGLARVTAGELTALTQNGAVLGTPAYMAPEQARGEVVDHRGDLFSLGCVLYRIVTGRLPFQGHTIYAVLAAIATETPPPVRDLNPEVPERLARLIERLLAKTPDERPASAQAVVDELQQIDKEVRSRPGAARPVVSSDIAPDDEPRAWWVAPWFALAAGAPLMVVLVAAMLVLAWGGSSQDPASVEPEKASLPIPEAKVTEKPEPRPPDTPAVAAPFDLLELIDPARDCTKGVCKKAKGGKGGALRVSHGGKKEGFLLNIHWHPPERYRLKLVVTRMNDLPDQLGVVLVGTTGKASFAVEWHDPKRRTSYTGLRFINGRPLPDRPDARKGPVLVQGLPTTLTYTVEPGHVSLDVNGRRVYRWEGDDGTVFNQGKGRFFHLYGVATADFRIDEMMLEPLGPDPGAAAGREDKR